jgi:hypothetical protein
VNRFLVLAVAAILGGAAVGGAAVGGAAVGGAAAGPGGVAPAPAVDRVLADPPPQSHVPAEPGGGVNTVPCPNCWN